MLPTLMLVLGMIHTPNAVSSGHAVPPQQVTPAPWAITHTYEARIRIAGTVSKVQVQARDAGHAKKLLRAQYGPEVAILSVQRID